MLKVYTHRWQERASREAAGLRLATHAAHLRLPDVLAHEERPGHLSWLVCTRLSGTQPARDAENATPVLGQVAARLHTLPAHRLDELPRWQRAEATRRCGLCARMRCAASVRKSSAMDPVRRPRSRRRAPRRTWAAMLHEHGFTTINARIEPAPEPDHVGTLIVEARA